MNRTSTCADNVYDVWQKLRRSSHRSQFACAVWLIIGYLLSRVAHHLVIGCDSWGRTELWQRESKRYYKVFLTQERKKVKEGHKHPFALPLRDGFAKLRRRLLYIFYVKIIALVHYNFCGHNLQFRFWIKNLFDKTTNPIKSDLCWNKNKQRFTIISVVRQR